MELCFLIGCQVGIQLVFQLQLVGLVGGVERVVLRAQLVRLLLAFERLLSSELISLFREVMLLCVSLSLLFRSERVAETDLYSCSAVLSACSAGSSFSLDSLVLLKAYIPAELPASTVTAHTAAMSFIRRGFKVSFFILCTFLSAVRGLYSIIKDKISNLIIT